MKNIFEHKEYQPKSICFISGGGQSSGSSQQASSGFRDLPPEIQNAFKDLATQTQSYLPGNNPGTQKMFTPLPQTTAETTAIGNINKGFTPTAQTYNADIQMQQNPFDKFVIDAINQQAKGQGSILNQATNQAGQFGSNRFSLGANDIDLSRLQQIGQFKQQQFGTASNNALNVLPQQRLADANAQLSTGGFQRQLNSQTNLAPITALQSLGQILQGLPTNSGQSSGNSSSSGFNFGLFNSDRSVKENIEAVGEENGYPVYKFNYIGNERKYIGVMADDVEKVMPDAVVIRNGVKAVNYDLIGVKFREANG